MGTLINSNNDLSKELIARIENARRAFINMKQFFCSRALNNNLKMRMLWCYIFIILLYGIEAGYSDKSHDEYRRILRISYVDEVTKELTRIYQPTSPKAI